MAQRRVQVFHSVNNLGKVLTVPKSLQDLIDQVQVDFSCSVSKICTVSGAEILSTETIRDDETLYINNAKPNEKETVTAITNEMENCFSSDDWISLNVGGTIFTTTRTTLVATETDSVLAKMFRNPKQWKNTVDKAGAVMLDRSPVYFEAILGFLRHGKLIIGPTVDPRGVLEEAEFFGMPSVCEQAEKMIQERYEESFLEPLTRGMVIKTLLVTPSKCELRFQGINFSGADLSRLDLRYINFKLANLSRCNLAQANLHCCSLERADLSGAILDGANLQGVRMICCNAEGSSMKGCNFDDPSGLKANMEGANMKGVNFEGSLMAGANLRVATVKNSNLKNCDLRGAILAGTDLENCDLSGCDLFEANLRGCNVKGTKFEEMITPLHMTQAVP